MISHTKASISDVFLFAIIDDEELVQASLQRLLKTCIRRCRVRLRRGVSQIRSLARSSFPHYRQSSAGHLWPGSSVTVERKELSDSHYFIMGKLNGIALQEFVLGHLAGYESVDALTKFRK